MTKDIGPIAKKIIAAGRMQRDIDAQPRTVRPRAAGSFASEQLDEHVFLARRRPRGMERVPPPPKLRGHGEWIGLAVRLDERFAEPIGRAQIDPLAQRIDAEYAKARLAQ